MKLLLITFLLLLASSSFSQSWQTIPMYHYTNEPLVFWDHGQWPFTLRHQHFKINPYDQSIWAVSDERVIKVDNQGDFHLWDESNCYFAATPQDYSALEFTPQNTFVSSYFTGLYKHDGFSWSTVSNLDKIISLSSDQDTLFAARVSAYYLNYVNGITTQGYYQGSKRIKSRNGRMVGCSDARYGALKDLGVGGSGSVQYIVGTDLYYLDYKNYDFKFTPNGDTLFTSGDRGFSIAVEGVFIDTLTKYNTINMPDLSILEFEFDASNNIWALLGSGGQSPSAEKLAFLDRSTNTWTTIYDEFNSPLDFPRVTIELDSNGNVWVANREFLHVLKLGNVPQWLGSSEMQEEESSFTVVPNPNKGEFQIVGTINFKMVHIFDQTGRLVYEDNLSHGSQKLNIALQSGIYQVRISDDTGRSSVKKVVIQ